MNYTELNATVLIISDDTVFRGMLISLLNLYNKIGSLNLNVVAQTDSLSSALKLFNRYKPNLILLASELNKENYLEIIQYLQTSCFHTKTLILSGQLEEYWIFKAMQSGANGYILKQNVKNQFCDAVNTILSSKIYLPPEVATHFFSYFHSDLTAKNAESFKLTNKEKEVLKYLVQGLSNQQIAKKMYISIATVKAHLTAIFNKLKVKNRYQAVIVTLKQNIVD